MNDTTKVIGVITAQLKTQGFSSRDVIAITANIGKETGFNLCEENLNYQHTPNERIRAIFGASRTSMSNDALTALKQSPEQFAEHMYGPGSRTGISLGNVNPGDGWKFRGRGYIQITGRTNYHQASQDLFHDTRLVDNPELLNDSQIAALTAGWYVKKAVPHMAAALKLNMATCSQEEANLVYTSAIAGQPITRGVGYLGTEVITKVDTWAKKIIVA